MSAPPTSSSSSTRPTLASPLALPTNKRAKVVANLVVARNQMTVKDGSSKALSNVDDRKRFHELRKSAKAIAIGGATYRNEPYQKASLPLYVSTRHVKHLGSGAIFLDLSPTELVKRASSEIRGTLLVEGGVNFLRELIEERMIDEFYLTRSDADGDDLRFDDELLRENYRLSASENLGNFVFQIWRPLS